LLKISLLALFKCTLNDEGKCQEERFYFVEYSVLLTEVITSGKIGSEPSAICEQPTTCERPSELGSTCETPVISTRVRPVWNNPRCHSLRGRVVASLASAGGRRRKDKGHCGRQKRCPRGGHSLGLQWWRFRRWAFRVGADGE